MVVWTMAGGARRRPPANCEWQAGIPPEQSHRTDVASITGESLRKVSVDIFQ